LLMIRPMKKQEQQRQALLSNVKRNDKVVTSGGLIGIVAAIKEKEDEITLRVDESSNVRLRVLKSSIVRVITDEASKDAKEA
jgi:preprotein translocase subunit YajC